ncbi:MAG TPA: N-acetylmuramoyl-L-alanine amidase [Phycisphaerae bacterium]|nr:N-acetylmuramoyl-L-alanine amidase [Phycisphaerae bacterium]
MTCRKNNRKYGSAWIVPAVLLLAGCRASDRHVELPSPQAQTRPAPQAARRPALPPADTEPSRLTAGKRVLVDAGHGGRDPGAWQATLSKLPEKTINLGIARGLAAALQRQGAAVRLTRSEDEFIDLQDRADLARQQQVDLMISVHANSAPGSNASGAEVYICRTASEASERAARQIESAFKRAGLACRGIRKANFVVLARHPRPAVLVECGFLTHPDDARRLNDPAFRARIAAAIADGVTRYLLREPIPTSPTDPLVADRQLVP